MLDHQTFEWDDAKALSNLAKHKVAFATAIAVFFDPDRLDIDTTRAEDRESRGKTVGALGGLLFTVVYTRRAEAIRIISARRSNVREMKDYGSRHT